MARIEFGTLQTHELSTVKPGWYLVEIITNDDPPEGMWGNVLMAIDPARRLQSIDHVPRPLPNTISARLDRLETELGKVRREIEQHVSYTHDREEPPYHPRTECE